MCVCVSLQEREGVLRERDDLKSLAEELGRELHQSKAQVGELRTQTDYLNTQLEVCTYWRAKIGISTHFETHLISKEGILQSSAHSFLDMF